MNISQYIKALKQQTDDIFNNSLENKNYLNNSHELITFLNKWHENLAKQYECCMLKNAIEEIEISLLNVSLGLYRSSYISLRLALEMLSGFIYFSTHDIEYKEWLQGEKDLIWAEISSHENGIVSKRFFKAYFNKLENTQDIYCNLLKTLYRDLSENVHGNSNTWEISKPELKYSIDKVNAYQSYIITFSKISSHLLCVRFLKEVNEEIRDDLILDENLENDNIRNFLGGTVCANFITELKV